MKDGLYPIVTGKNSFRELIESGRPYVDKTEVLFNLLRKPSKYYTFSRPDGFGKTTLLDTIEELFSGQKDLFKGLYIEDKWNFEDTYPVIRLDLDKVSVESGDSFIQTLYDNVILAQAKKLGIDISLFEEKDSPSIWMNQLISGSVEKYGKRAVILFDGFDSPMLASVGGDSFEIITRRVYSLFSCLKPRQTDIRFCFLAGTTYYTPNTIFSGFNNAIDISDDPDYAAICGYTDEEIDKYVSPCFEKHFSENGISSDEEKTAFRNRVREYYGGYRFSARNPVTLYNPVSIGKFVESGCVFANYWREAGVQPLVKELIKVNAEYLKEKEEFRSIAEKATIFDVQELIQEKASYSIVYSFLLQTGWLSSGMVDKYHWVTMRYPNREIEETMAEIIGEV